MLIKYKLGPANHRQKYWTVLLLFFSFTSKRNIISSLEPIAFQINKHKYSFTNKNWRAEIGTSKVVRSLCTSHCRWVYAGVRLVDVILMSLTMYFNLAVYIAQNGTFLLVLHDSWVWLTWHWAFCKWQTNMYSCLDSALEQHSWNSPLYMCPIVCVWVGLCDKLLT